MLSGSLTCSYCYLTLLSHRKKIGNKYHISISENPPENKTRMDSTTRKDRRSAEDSMRRNKRTDNQNDTSGESYSNYTRLLQLFPYFHPVAIDRIFANCNRDFIRTIDNLLYIKRYFNFVQTNDWYPHTTSTTDPSTNVFAHNMNTDSTRTTDVHQGNNSNNDDDDDDGYIPNGNIEGIREEIRRYEEQCSLTESTLNDSLEVQQCSTSIIVDPSNFHTSTPQARPDSDAASDHVNVNNIPMRPN